MVIGHRGAMGYETENSLASVQKALDFNVDMIEIDVFKVRGDAVVVFHDEEISRLTDGVGNIEEFTEDQLEFLTLSGGHKIPNLKVILELIDGRCMLNVELKGAGTAAPVSTLIHEYIEKGNWKKEDFLISSFNWKELELFYELDTEIAIGILIEEKDPIEAIEIGKKINAIAIHPDFNLLNQENIDVIRDEGFKIYTWTVNAPEDIEEMKNLGVDGIITNFPDRV